MEEYFLELENIYNELDRELEGFKVRCKGCGRCCYFRIFGHILFASTLEKDYILKNLKNPLPKLEDDICPFLSHNQCYVRNYRTLGCRVFFCDEAYNKELSQDIYNYLFFKTLLKGVTSLLLFSLLHVRQQQWLRRLHFSRR